MKKKTRTKHIVHANNNTLFTERNLFRILIIGGLSLLIISVTRINTPGPRNNLATTQPISAPISTPTQISSTPRPTPITKMLPAVKGNCPDGTYFADMESVSFCYPDGWQAVQILDIHFSAKIVNGENSIYIVESYNFEIPAGGKGEQKNREMRVDGHWAEELISNNGQMGLFIINKEGPDVDTQSSDIYGFYVTYSHTKTSSPIPETVREVFSLIEQTLHIKQW